MTENERKSSSREREKNPDPITGEPGSHPVGTGVGAATAGAAGAAMGSVVGPVGSAVGAVIGAVVGGYAGKGIAEAVDPTEEDAYWREHHREQSFAEDRPYPEYAPAYRVGYIGYRPGQTFAQREEELRREYESSSRQPEETIPGTMQNNLSTYPVQWPQARQASQAAYERVQRRLEKADRAE